ncbi:MAG: DUF1592 domain-containing protein [Planctomycetota bacterium]
MGRFLLIGWLILAPVGAEVRAQPAPLEQVRPFLQQHCYECHGPQVQKNELRFDNLETTLKQPEIIATWQSILDELNLGAMPPETNPQPPPAEVAKVIDLIGGELRQTYAKLKSTGGQTVARRLNRYEVRSTLRDLLYLEDHQDFRPDLVAKLEDRNGNGVTTWNTEDPTREFPADQLEDGFDNIGGKLVMSDFLLTQLIGAAEYSLQLATFPTARPPLDIRTYRPPIRRELPGGSFERFSQAVHKDFDGIYERYREPGAAASGLGRVSADELARNGVSVPGRYRITIDVSAHNQHHRWTDLISTKPDESLLMGLHISDARSGGMNDGNPNERMLTQWTLVADGVTRSYTFETWLGAHWLPWIGWENGPHFRGLPPSKLVEKYLPDAYQPVPKQDAPKEERETYEPRMAQVLFTSGYQGPHLRIHRLTVEPLITAWPPASHVALYGQRGDEPVEELLLRFARRAFRRSVTAAEIASYRELVESEMREGRSRDEALRAGYTAIIASPRFYYLQERDGRLSDEELACRLSYFLWSSLPDDKLFELAAQEKLRDPAVLRAQVERMLEDPKSAAFIRRFPERWLRLYKLGTMPPPGGFYHHRLMETQMRLQMDAYFGDLLKHNGPVRHLIDSDYTFLNERMAQWIYDRQDVWGDGYRRVPARAPHGGGLITMPAIMTATANGVDTSPVVRGVWVLECLLGTPPAPPPPDVEPLSPDLRGAATIREQLEKHRRLETCNACHRKIDPLGFALENFDPVGRWRTTYPDSKQRIDPSATLIGGRQIEDLNALKKWLLERETMVTQHLAATLLTYATGRVMEVTDRGEVERLVRDLQNKPGGLRDLIHLVVQSELFQRK